MQWTGWQVSAAVCWKTLNTKTGTIEDFTAFILFSCSTVEYLDLCVVADMILLIKTWHMTTVYLWLLPNETVFVIVHLFLLLLVGAQYIIHIENVVLCEFVPISIGCWRRWPRPLDTCVVVMLRHIVNINLLTGCPYIKSYRIGYPNVNFLRYIFRPNVCFRWCFLKSKYGFVLLY